MLSRNFLSVMRIMFTAAFMGLFMGQALADHSIQRPSDIKVVIRDGTVVPQGNITGIRVRGQALEADLVIKIDWDQVWREAGNNFYDKTIGYYVRTKLAPNNPALKFPAGPSPTASANNIPLASFIDLTGACGAGAVQTGQGFGIYQAEAKLGVIFRIEKKIDTFLPDFIDAAANSVASVTSPEHKVKYAESTVKLPIAVQCVKSSKEKAAVSTVAYGYECSGNRFVVKGTTKRSTDRMSPIPQPIPDNTCVPLPEVQTIIMQTCPTGYVLRGTNLNSKQTENQQPATCVWPTPSGQVQTQQQHIQQQAAHPNKTAQVSSQYQYTCPPNYVLPGTTVQVMSYPGTKTGLTCEPKAGTPPKKADIWLIWQHSCPQGMIIQGVEGGKNSVTERLLRGQEPQNRWCVPPSTGGKG